MEQYFWLICGLWCGIGGGFFMWLRLRKYLMLGIFSEEDAKYFSKRMALWILIPSLILWVLQLSIGSKATPQFLNWPSPQKQIAVGLQIFIHLALIYWVFLKNGANTLSMYFGSGGKTLRFVYSPIAMKLITIAIVMSGFTALLSRNNKFQ
jgi:hypothetical protein